MLTSSETGLSFKSIRKAKIPHRIKLFLWLLENQVVLTKDNLLKRNWQGDPLAISAPPMRISITCSSCVLWLKLSGGQWPYAWVLITFPRIFFSIRSGLHTGYLLVTQSILSAWVQFAGLSGKNEMKFASKINHQSTQLISFYTLVLLWHIGQGCTGQTYKERSWMVWRSSSPVFTRWWRSREAPRLVSC